jgi:ubiquinone biosynthesis protein UbiJ
MDRITYRTNRQILEQIDEQVRQLRVDVNDLTKRVEKLEKKVIENGNGKV